MPDMKRCMEPHALLHTGVGIGLGLVLVGLVPSVATNALMWGIVVVVARFVGEFLVK